MFLFFLTALLPNTSTLELQHFMESNFTLSVFAQVNVLVYPSMDFVGFGNLWRFGISLHSEQQSAQVERDGRRLPIKASNRFFIASITH